MVVGDLSRGVRVRVGEVGYKESRRSYPKTFVEKKTQETTKG